MTGICERCQNGIEAREGQTIFCEHHRAGSVYKSFFGFQHWITVSPIDLETFRIFVLSLEAAAPKEIIQEPAAHD